MSRGDAPLEILQPKSRPRSATPATRDHRHPRGSYTVVGHALCARPESSGYRTTPIETYPAGIVEELLDETNLLLLAPRPDEGLRKAFLGAMGKGALLT